MQELQQYQVRWHLVTDSNEYTITEDQMKALIRAESVGARFVFFENCMINLAYLKEAYKEEVITKGKVVFNEKEQRAYRSE